LREELLRAAHLLDDVSGRLRPVSVAADGLRPEAERAASGAAATRIEREVRVLEVADEVVLDLEIALVDVEHARERVHVVDELALAVVVDLAVLVAPREPVHVGEIAALSDLGDRVVELLAADEVDRLRGEDRLLRHDGDVRAAEADLD